MVNEFDSKVLSTHPNAKMAVAILQQLILLSEQYQTLNELMENKKNYLREQVLLARERRSMHQKRARFLLGALMLSISNQQRANGLGEYKPEAIELDIKPSRLFFCNS